MISGIPSDPASLRLQSFPEGTPNQWQDLQKAVRVDDVVTARVLTSTGDKALLDVGGLHVVAQSSVPLKAGDEVFLKVSAVAPDRVELRVLTRDQALQASQRLVKALEAAEVEVTPQNLQVAKDAVEYGFPPTRETLEEILSLQLPAEAYGAKKEAIFVVRALGLPMNGETVSVVDGFLKNRDALTSDLKSLQSLVEQVEGGSAPGPVSEMLGDADLTGLLQKVRQIADGSNLSPARLGQVVKEFSLSAEGRIASVLEGTAPDLVVSAQALDAAEAVPGQAAPAAEAVLSGKAAGSADALAAVTGKGASEEALQAAAAAAQGASDEPPAPAKAATSLVPEAAEPAPQAAEPLPAGAGRAPQAPAGPLPAGADRAAQPPVEQPPLGAETPAPRAPTEPLPAGADRAPQGSAPGAPAPPVPDPAGKPPIAAPPVAPPLEEPPDGEAPPSKDDEALSPVAPEKAKKPDREAPVEGASKQPPRDDFREVRDSLGSRVAHLARRLERALAADPALQDQPIVKDLHRILRSIEDTLTGQKLVNASPLHKDDEGRQYLTIPLTFPGQQEDKRGELQIFVPRDRKKKQGKEALRVAFVLDTDTLGTLGIDLGIKERSIDCGIKVENERIRRYVEDNTHLLKKGLEALDYRVGDIRTSVCKVAFSREVPQKKVDLSRAGRIDLRA